MNTRQVIKLSGASARQLQWWDDWDIVRPAIYGHQRYYTAAQTTDCMVIMDLKRKGIPLRLAKLSLAVVASQEHSQYLVVDEKGRANGAFDLAEAAKLAASHPGPVSILPIRRHFDDGVIPKKFLPKPSRAGSGPKLPCGPPNVSGSLTKFERHMTAVALSSRSASFPAPHRQDYFSDRDTQAGRSNEAAMIASAMKTRAKLSIDGQ